MLILLRRFQQFVKIYCVSFFIVVLASIWATMLGCTGHVVIHNNTDADSCDSAYNQACSLDNKVLPCSSLMMMANEDNHGCVSPEKLLGKVILDPMNTVECKKLLQGQYPQTTIIDYVQGGMIVGDWRAATCCPDGSGLPELQFVFERGVVGEQWSTISWGSFFPEMSKHSCEELIKTVLASYEKNVEYERQLQEIPKK